MKDRVAGAGVGRSQGTRRAEFWAGVRDTLPLEVGAAPFGLIFGALAVTSGLSPSGAMAMSLFVFAGSSQFIAAGLVASGAGIGIIVLTTFIVNLRHALYSATLAPHLKGLPQRWLIPLGFWLTDESFVVAARRFSQPDPSRYKHWYFLGSAVFMYTNWQLWTYIGLRMGQAVPAEQVMGLGLDFAALATFTGMLVPLLRTRPMAFAALVGGVSAVLFYPLPGRIGLIIAALLGVAAGVISEAQIKPVSGEPEPKPEPESQAEAVAHE
ncbi:MAG: AzlC family ABC transporter permease [Anaerolineae bacterium]|nr:AzlC family ABC transporter permease [Anaerolineae bacterium]